jgi:hypothetical protein
MAKYVSKVIAIISNMEPTRISISDTVRTADRKALISFHNRGLNFSLRNHNIRISRRKGSE